MGLSFIGRFAHFRWQAQSECICRFRATGRTIHLLRHGRLFHSGFITPGRHVPNSDLRTGGNLVAREMRIFVHNTNMVYGDKSIVLHIL